MPMMPMAPKKFIIPANEYLKFETIAFHRMLYRGFEEPGNPDFLNTLKNIFNTEEDNDLEAAMNTVIGILIEDIPNVMQKMNLQSCICVCVPRARAKYQNQNTQLMFKQAIRNAISNLNNDNIIDGTACITRIKNTLTTHLRDATKRGRISRDVNDGPEPYRGITKDTCQIDESIIKGKIILLIDDIYTKKVNIDEDCIQALFDKGAKDVIFYAIAFTERR
jgi:phosphotransferase system IIB component